PSEKNKSLEFTSDLLYIVATENPENWRYSQKTGFYFITKMKIQRISDFQGRLSLFSPPRRL
ncbi:hypothetical protein, partial [Polaribacter porphyrae]|uniref:hypothetical protein n=1 Tax=Polaribacter porphyrae TaxID=1137780 RepID=UPI001CFFCBE3